MIAVVAALAAVLPRLVSLAPTPVKSPPALQWTHEAVTGVTVTVSPSGEVMDCRPQATSFYPELDAQACPAVQGARFAPATDVKGAPAYGVVDMQVRWPQGVATVGAGSVDVELSVARLPAGMTGRPVADLVLSVSRTGRIDSCDVVASTGSATLDATACAAGVKAANIGPVVTSDGASVASIRSLRVRFVVRPLWEVPTNRGRTFPKVYPDRAQRMGVTGFAIARCQADTDGVLKDCTVAEEGPPGAGFGHAAVRLIGEAHMRVAPDQQGEVFIPIGFYLQPCPKPPYMWASVCGIPGM